VFIVLTFGISAGNLPLAATGAAIAGAIVLAIGAAVHRPLSRAPENTLKFGVGILLSTFGTFWAIEGLGVFSPGHSSLEWPSGDLALVGVLIGWIVVSRALVAGLRRRVPAAAG